MKRKVKNPVAALLMCAGLFLLPLTGCGSDSGSEDPNPAPGPVVNPTDSNKTDNGKTDSGKTENGKTDSGKTENGNSENGKPSSGSTTKTKYTLSFYTSEYSVSPEEVSVEEDSLVPESSLPEAKSKTGYDFKGWYVSGDEAKTVIDFKTYKVKASKSFRPKYEPGTYTATFVTDHGKAPAPVSWTYEESYYSTNSINITKEPYVLSATGYTFKGWYKEEEKDLPRTSINFHFDIEDLTLIAKWVPWKATVVFNSNGASGVMGTVSAEYNTATTLPKNKFYATGYVFAGWNTQKDGKGVSYADGSSLTWKGASNGDTLTLYAQWKRTQTVVKVDLPAPESLSDITLKYDSEAKAFKAELPGAVAYKWFVDGEELTGETGASLSQYALSAGVHSVMVQTDFGGRTYATAIAVSVSELN